MRVFLKYLFIVLAWSLLSFGLAFRGFWMESVAVQENYDEFFDWAVNEIDENNKGTAALTLIENGEIVHQFYKGDINENTLFPTASFSKWITALTVMSLVEKNKIDLDSPISNYLTQWNLPISKYDNNQVTVRRLLSHTSGLTDELGFGDYKSDETLPGLIDELNNPRASNGLEAKIILGQEPGSKFIYSGGGYLILQLLVTEVTGIEFEEYVKKTLLAPIGMNRSNYKYLGTQDNISLSFYADGSIAPTYKYASAAATAFSSTASELSKLVLALSKEENSLIEANTLEAMLEPHGFLFGSGIWGLGTMLYVKSNSGNYVFGHDGANDPAINSSVRINPETSDGIIILVSGNPILATNIGSEWVLWQTGHPDFLSTEDVIKSALYPTLIGVVLIFLLSIIRAKANHFLSKSTARDNSNRSEPS